MPRGRDAPSKRRPQVIICVAPPTIQIKSCFAAPWSALRTTTKHFPVRKWRGKVRGVLASGWSTRNYLFICHRLWVQIFLAGFLLFYLRIQQRSYSTAGDAIPVHWTRRHHPKVAGRRLGLDSGVRFGTLLVLVALVLLPLSGLPLFDLTLLTHHEFISCKYIIYFQIMLLPGLTRRSAVMANATFYLVDRVWFWVQVELISDKLSAPAVAGNQN